MDDIDSSNDLKKTDALRDEVIRRMANTPPKPKAEPTQEKKGATPTGAAPHA